MSARGAAHVKRKLTDVLVRAGYSNAMVADARRTGRWWLLARRDALRRGRGLVRGWTILWTESGSCDLVPVEVPLAGTGEVTVDLEVSAVSPGTERAQFLRLPNAQVELPYRPGYSAAGHVRAVGRGVPGLQPGDSVAVIRAPHASVVTIPATDVFVLPAQVAPEAGALIRLGIVSMYGIRRARLVAGEGIVVVGAGAVGALVERIARARGADPTVVVTRTSRRREAMLAAGAGAFIAIAEDPEAATRVSAPLVMEATGSPEAVTLAIRFAEEGGRVVVLGSPRGRTRDFPLALVRERGLQLLGAHVAQLANESVKVGRLLERELGEAFLDDLAASRIDVTDLVGTPTDPREAATFYRELATDPNLVGAHFDWTVLGSAERPGRSRLVQPPQIAARGVDLERRPERATLAVADDYQGAAGMLRIALVGCGDIAVKNAAGAAAAPNVKLVACFDAATELAEELGRAHGCDVEQTFEATLDRRDVDAVFLCVPHDLHAPLASQAIEAGKHVVVEKPLANNLAAAAETVAAAEAAGVTLSVCFPHRYAPGSELAKRLVVDGVLGELGGTLTTFLTDKPVSYWGGGFSGRAQSNWRTSRSRAGGGVLIMNLTHYVDLIRYVTEMEVETVAAVGASADRVGEVEDTVSVSLRYTNGAIGTLFGCSAVRGIAGRNELRIWGQDGQLSLEPDLRVFSLRALNGLRTGRWLRPAPLPRRNIRAVYLSRLGTAIAEDRPPDVTPRDALVVQALVDAAYRAQDHGIAVRPAALLEDVYR